MRIEKYWRNNGKDNKMSKMLTHVLFVIYLIVLIWILLFKLGVRFSYMEGGSINLIPFAEPLISNGKVDVSEIILNVVIFVPLGVYAGVLYKWWAFRIKLVFFFLVSLVSEVLQFTKIEYAAGTISIV